MPRASATAVAVFVAVLVTAGEVRAQTPEAWRRAAAIPGRGEEGEPGAWAGRRVREVELVLPERVDAALVRRHVSIRKDAPLDRATVRATVEALYETGRFVNVSVFVDPRGATDGSVVVIVEPVPKSTLRAITVRGDTVLGEQRVADLTGLRPGDELAPATVVDRLSRIQQAYADAGYRHARVTADTVPHERGREVTLILRVEEGRPTLVSEVRFEVLGGVSEPVRRALDLRWNFREGSVAAHDAAEDAARDLKKALRKEGLLEAQVEALPFEPAVAADDPRRLVGAALDDPEHPTPQRLRVEILPGPHVLVAFKGVRRFTRAQLEGALALAEESHLTAATLEYVASELERFYHWRGFAEAKVAVSMRSRWPAPGRPAEKRVTFLVHEGEQSRVTSVKFRGTKRDRAAELEARARASVEEALLEVPELDTFDAGDVDTIGLSGRPRPWEESLERPTLLSVAPADTYAPDLYAEIPTVVGDYYKTQGYRRARILGPEVGASARGGHLYPRFDVAEGPQTRVRHVEIEGATVPFRGELNALVTLGPGDPLDDFAVEASREAISQRYAQSGYIYADVRVEGPNVLPGEKQADVKFVVHEHEEVHVASVQLRGNAATRDLVIRDAFGLGRGDLVTPQALHQGARRLDNLGVFSSVSATMAHPREIEATKDIVVDLRERPAQAHEVRIGVSTEDGPRLAYEYSHANLGGYALAGFFAAKVNYQVFLGLLEASQAKGRDFAQFVRERSFVDRLERELDAGLLYPRIFGLGPYNVTARFDTIVQRDNVPAFGGFDRVAVVPRLETRINRWIPALQYEAERNDVDCLRGECVNPNDPSAVFFGGSAPPEGVSVIGTTRVTLTYDHRDSALNPHEGLIATTAVDWSRSFPLSEYPVGFFKLQAGLTGYIPFGRTVTLALQARAGRIFKYEPLVPPLKEFTLGGRMSQRGYAQDLMVADDTQPPDAANAALCRELAAGDREFESLSGEELASLNCPTPGGHSFVLYKAELRFPLAGALSLALFTDAGNLWRDAESLDAFKLRYAVGTGIRYDTPVGPVALDTGFNLSRRAELDESLFNVFFSIGVF